MRRFENKVVLITGAAAGIGRATALRLAQEGADLFLVDLAEEKLKETADLASESGGRVEHRACDLSHPETAGEIVGACVDALGRLDALCNIAGIVRMDRTHELDLEDWNRVIAINLTGTMLMCRAAIPHLLETRGNIVNIGSTSGLQGMPWGAAYASSKGGVIALTRALAVEYGGQGMRANAICPGSIDTAMTNPDMIPKGADMKLIHRIMPLDQSRGPETVASVIAMLASDDGVHINGETIRVDDGTLA